MTQKGWREIHKWFWLENMKDFQDTNMYSTTILKWILKKMYEQT